MAKQDLDDFLNTLLVEAGGTPLPKKKKSIPNRQGPSALLLEEPTPPPPWVPTSLNYFVTEITCRSCSMTTRIPTYTGHPVFLHLRRKSYVSRSKTAGLKIHRAANKFVPYHGQRTDLPREIHIEHTTCSLCAECFEGGWLPNIVPIQADGPACELEPARKAYYQQLLEEKTRDTMADLAKRAEDYERFQSLIDLGFDPEFAIPLDKSHPCYIRRNGGQA